ncbi:primosomal protein [Demequina litorisediminis]|uniref:Primosomal protein n=1 Tax=Demequina litorisediminis TaxID=1849022 RepID=A0ABQ6IJC1_9MICO|nr:primosomal protein [Demequina litorisediminis]GMA37410.1 hypothetical protein GCM10025876_36140 [Demequina litorisediminis]
MSAEAREALRRLTAAFEEHLEAVTSRRGEEDATVDDAYEALAEAFVRYEEVLDVEYAETLPVLLDEDFDEEALDGHAEEDDEALDDDLDDFDLRQE